MKKSIKAIWFINVAIQDKEGKTTYDYTVGHNY